MGSISNFKAVKNTPHGKHDFIIRIIVRYSYITTSTPCMLKFKLLILVLNEMFYNDTLFLSEYVETSVLTFNTIIA